jgi:hypothetical protein
MATQPKKHDFAGENKTSKTYDKDWVFVKNKGPQPGGNWMTRRQARRQHEDQRQAQAGQTPVAPVPGGRSAPTPITGTPAPVPAPIAPILSDTTTQIEQMPNTNVPAWWINQAYANPQSEDQKFANAANAILPTLSPEDARNLGSYLATNFKDVFGGYANADFAPIPTQLTRERGDYLNPQRAQAALGLLDRMRQASGVPEAGMGKGYDFLKNALTLMNKYSSGGPMTREQYDQFTSGVSALTSQAGKDISAYSNLAQLFNLPNFTAGPIVSNASNKLLNT